MAIALGAVLVAGSEVPVAGGAGIGSDASGGGAGFGIAHTRFAAGTSEDIAEIARIRAGFGLYADLQFVRELAKVDENWSRGLPIPVHENEVGILDRNRVAIDGAGSWFANEQETSTSVIRDVAVTGSASLAGPVRFSIATTDPAMTATDLDRQTWAKGSNLDVRKAKTTFFDMSERLHALGDGRFAAAQRALGTPITGVRFGPESDELVIGVANPSSIAQSRVDDVRDVLDGAVRLELRGRAERTCCDGYENQWVDVSANHDVAASTHLTFGPAGSNTKVGWCTNNLVVTDGTYFLQTTAQHCLDGGGSTLYTKVWDGNYFEGGVLTLLSDGLSSFNRSDGSDVAFYRVPSFRESDNQYMRILSGSPLMRTTNDSAGTTNPVTNGSYCIANHNTRAESYGYECVTFQYAGQYVHSSDAGWYGETLYGWVSQGTSLITCKGESGSPWFTPIAGGTSRYVGVQSATVLNVSASCGNQSYFALVINAMSGYSLSANQ